MLPHTPTSKPKTKEFFPDRKKLVSQVDLRNIRPMEDKIAFASPKFVNYAASLTQKNSSSKKISFGITSPKSFFPPYRKEGQESLNSYQRSETMKSFSNRLDSKSHKDSTITEGLSKTDTTYKAYANSSSVVLQAATKNLTLNPKKSYKTDVSTVESKADVLDKALSPKYEEKYKSVKQNEVVKQIEAQIQLHRRVKKPNQATKSVALTTPKDLSLGNDSKFIEATSHRRSNSTKDVPWSKLELPVGPEVVLDRYSSFLAPHEREEIKRYPEIYYISDLGHKLPAKEEAECDDERGDYIVIRNDHIQYRYEVLEMVGRGSFGQVMKVYDHKTKEHVALKIIRSPKKFHIQAKVEIKLLKYMMDNNAQDFNITELKDYFVFRKHVCIVFDLMSLNLYDFLKKNKFKGFSLNVIRKFAIQILYALKFLAQHKIIHCDLKPENILLKQFNKTGVKLIDFGSSCFESEKLYTYIQSRFYRSPEIILGLSYSTQIDMWSFGCLLCELYLGYPLFAGDSEQDQLLAMIEVLGCPDAKLITPSPKKSKFFEDDLAPKIVPNAKGKIRKPNSINLDTTLNCEDESFVDLVKNCLRYDQNERFTPTSALAHEWILKGLPPELKAQHMKLLEKSNAPTYRLSSCKDRSSTLDLKDSDEYALSRQDRSTNDTTRSKHKKTISVPVQRADLSKGLLGNISTSFKADKTVDEKSIQALYKKGSNISTNTAEEDSIANITINLNESKQSAGTNKKYPNSKPSSSYNTPQASKDSKVGNFNNFFAAHNQKVLQENLRKQQSMETPKKSSKEEEEETIVNKLRNSYMGNFHITKVNKRTLSQKSFSIDKNLFSPKGSENLFKNQQQNEDSNHRVMSASRGGNFPSLKSPNAKKK